MTNNRTTNHEKTRFYHGFQREGVENRPHNRPQNRSRGTEQRRRQPRRTSSNLGSDLLAYLASLPTAADPSPPCKRRTQPALCLPHCLKEACP